MQWLACLANNQKISSSNLVKGCNTFSMHIVLITVTLFNFNNAISLRILPLRLSSSVNVVSNCHCCEKKLDIFLSALQRNENDIVMNSDNKVDAEEPPIDFFYL